MKSALINYFKESYQELQKVTWPTRTQAVRMTFLVLAFCLVTAVIIGVMDFAFRTGHEFLLNSAPAAEVAAPTFDVGGITAETVDGQTIPLNITEEPAGQ